jgi:hypothetical protein
MSPAPSAGTTDDDAGDPRNGDREPERLDWEAFSARNFPGRHRHDLIAVTAYAAYRRDLTPGR